MNIYTPKNPPKGFYIYAYLRTIDSTPYYIGKGHKKRAWGKHPGISVPKDPTKIVFMECNLTDIGALALERFYIRWYGRKDNGTGILLNRTDGGDGSAGYIPSAETRLKCAEAAKRKVVTDSMRDNYRKSKIGINNPNYGKPETANRFLKYTKCVHCGMISILGNIQRWHNDNCKSKFQSSSPSSDSS